MAHEFKVGVGESPENDIAVHGNVRFVEGSRIKCKDLSIHTPLIILDYCTETSMANLTMKEELKTCRINGYDAKYLIQLLRVESKKNMLWLFPEVIAEIIACYL